MSIEPLLPPSLENEQTWVENIQCSLDGPTTRQHEELIQKYGQEPILGLCQDETGKQYTQPGRRGVFIAAKLVDLQPE